MPGRRPSPGTTLRAGWGVSLPRSTCQPRARRSSSPRRASSRRGSAPVTPAPSISMTTCTSAPSGPGRWSRCRSPIPPWGRSFTAWSRCRVNIRASSAAPRTASSATAARRRGACPGISSAPSIPPAAGSRSFLPDRTGSTIRPLSPTAGGAGMSLAVTATSGTSATSPSTPARRPPPTPIPPASTSPLSATASAPKATSPARAIWWRSPCSPTRRPPTTR